MCLFSTVTVELHCTTTPERVGRARRFLDDAIATIWLITLLFSVLFFLRIDVSCDRVNIRSKHIGRDSSYQIRFELKLVGSCFCAQIDHKSFLHSFEHAPWQPADKQQKVKKTKATTIKQLLFVWACWLDGVSLCNISHQLLWGSNTIFIHQSNLHEIAGSHEPRKSTYATYGRDIFEMVDIWWFCDFI